MSLVADYGTSSESTSDSDSESDSKEIPNEDHLKTAGEKLPGPAFGAASTSVFSNPFQDAENAKKAILEKHVKMVPSKDETRVINGKKICWNYRKGRCRFGHKCVFAHDSDLQKDDLDPEQRQTSVICENIQGDSQARDKQTEIRKKKRPGLTQGLVPGKKVMKMFHTQQNTHK